MERISQTISVIALALSIALVVTLAKINDQVNDIKEMQKIAESKWSVHLDGGWDTVYEAQTIANRFKDAKKDSANMESKIDSLANKMGFEWQEGYKTDSEWVKKGTKKSLPIISLDKEPKYYYYSGSGTTTTVVGN